MPTIKELKESAKGLKIKGYSNMDKGQLIEAVSKARVEDTITDFQTKPVSSAPLADAIADDVSEVGFLRRRWGAVFTVCLLAMSGFLYYMTRPEPTVWEKLMGYLPF